MKVMPRMHGAVVALALSLSCWARVSARNGLNLLRRNGFSSFIDQESGEVTSDTIKLLDPQHPIGDEDEEFWDRFLLSSASTSKSCGNLGGTCSGKSRASSDDLPLCVGIRGNGRRVFSHFPALARIVEEVGPIAAAAGGSSGSAVTFFLESIQSNPLVYGAPCGGDGIGDDDIARRARTSFLLKSVESINEIINFIDPFSEEALAEMLDAAEGVLDGEELSLDDLFAIVDKFKSFINPEFLELLENSPNPLGHLVDIVMTLVNFSFVVDSPKFFVRPTPINFENAILDHDAIASFYSGYEPVDMDEMEYMLDQCALKGYGKEWNVASETITDSGMSCGELFEEIVRKFLALRDLSSGHRRRLDDPLGTEHMVSVLATSAIKGDGIDVYNKAKEEYFTANNPTELDLKWDMNFDDVRFGYWMDDAFLDRAKRGMTKFTDLKSKKAYLVGQTTWGDMLLRSGAEPGLSNGIDGPDGDFVTTGGWADLVPTQVLSALGCRRIMLIARPGAAGPFQTSIEETLNASEDDLKQLNDLDLETSGWSVALSLSDATMCGDYDVPEIGDIRAIANVGWEGPLVTSDQCFINLFDSSEIEQVQEKRACSPVST